MSDPQQVETVTLMYVPGRSGRIRRFHLPRFWLRRASIGGIVFALLLGLLSVDYVRVRHQLSDPCASPHRWRRR